MFLIAFVVFSLVASWRPIVTASPLGTARVIGGTEAAIEQYPFVVSIRVSDHHNCGGSIITVDSVLTAAHCVAGIDITKLTIRAGHTLHSKGEAYNVSQYLMHAAYNPKNLENDVAILKLTAPLVFSSTVQSISVLSQRPPDGAPLAVIGWGMFGPGTRSSASLKAADIQLLPQQACQEFYKRTSMKITPKVLCASNENSSRNSCPGDSGGPLIHVPTRSLLGIVSFGMGCGVPTPGGYTSVPDFLQWIQRYG